MFFAASENGILQPWMTDGTAAGTVKVSVVETYYYPNFTEYKGKLYFLVNNQLPSPGNEIWTTDGTAANTNFYYDLNSTPGDWAQISKLTVFNDLLYIVAKTSSIQDFYELYSTNGNPLNTAIVFSNPQENIEQLQECNTSLFFTTLKFSFSGVKSYLYAIDDGPAIVWTGNVSTKWNSVNNWFPKQVPLSTNSVIIPNGRTHYPKICSTVTANCKNLKIESDASINMTGGTFNVFGKITAADADMLNLDGGTMVLYHGSVFPDDINFNNLTLIASNNDLYENTYEFNSLSRVKGNLVITVQ